METVLEFILGIAFLIVCGITIILCLYSWWVKMKRRNAQIYTIESLPTTRKNSILKIINIFKNFNNIENSEGKQPIVDQNLMDSTDLSNKFSNSLLRISQKSDEIGSYDSTSSLRTYHSVNISRSNSKCSFVSCSEGSDNGNSILV